jgi:hypothetical protein
MTLSQFWPMRLDDPDQKARDLNKLPSLRRREYAAKSVLALFYFISEHILVYKERLPEKGQILLICPSVLFNDYTLQCNA